LYSGHQLRCLEINTTMRRKKLLITDWVPGLNDYIDHTHFVMIGATGETFIYQEIGKSEDVSSVVMSIEMLPDIIKLFTK